MEAYSPHFEKKPLDVPAAGVDVVFPADGWQMQPPAVAEPKATGVPAAKGVYPHSERFAEAPEQSKALELGGLILIHGRRYSGAVRVGTCSVRHRTSTPAPSEISTGGRRNCLKIC